MSTSIESHKVGFIEYPRLNEVKKEKNLYYHIFPPGKHFFAVYDKDGSKHYLYIPKESSFGKALSKLLSLQKDVEKITAENVKGLYEKFGGLDPLLEEAGRDSEELLNWIDLIESGLVDFVVVDFQKPTRCTLQKGVSFEIEANRGRIEIKADVFRPADQDPILLALKKTLETAGNKEALARLEQPGIIDLSSMDEYETALQDNYLTILLEFEGNYGPALFTLADFYTRHSEAITGKEENKIPPKKELISSLSVSLSLSPEKINLQLERVLSLIYPKLQQFSSEEEIEIFLKCLYILLMSTKENKDLSGDGLLQAIEDAEIAVEVLDTPRERNLIREFYWELERNKQGGMLAGEMIRGIIREAQPEKYTEGQDFKRQVILNAVSILVKSYDPRAYAYLENVASIPQMAISPELTEAREIATKFSNLPTENYIVTLKCTLRGLGKKGVSSPREAYLTADDVDLIARTFAAEKFTVNIADVEGMLALAEEAMVNTNLSKSDKATLGKIFDGKPLQRWEYAELPTITKKVKSDKAKSFLAKIYPEKYWEKQQTEEALRYATKHKIIIPKAGLSPQQVQILEKYAVSLREGNEVVYTLYGKEEALSILRELGFALSAITPVPEEMDNKQVVVDALNPLGENARNSTKEQIVRFEGGMVANQLAVLKGIYFAENSNKYKEIVRQLAEARKELEALGTGEKNQEKRVEILARLQSLERERTLLFEAMSGPSVNPVLWNKFRISAQRIEKIGSYFDLFGLDAPFSIPVAVVGWDIVQEFNEKGAVRFIEDVLREDGKWENLSPEPGDSRKTIVAKMAFSKLLYAVNLSVENKINLISTTSRVIPGMLTLLGSVASELTETGEVQLNSQDNLFSSATLVANNLAGIISSSTMEQPPMNISTYLHFLLFREAEDSGTAYFKRFSGTEAEVLKRINLVTADDVKRLAEYLGRLIKGVNNLPFGLKKVIIAKIKTGKIKGLQVTKDKSGQERIAVKQKIKVNFQESNLYDPEHEGDPDKRNTSQLVMDAWVILDALQPSRKEDFPYALALQKGMEETFGKSQEVKFYSYENVGFFGKIAEELGIGNNRVVPLRQRTPFDPFRAPLPIYLVPYQLAMLGVGLGTKGAEATYHAVMGMQECLPQLLELEMACDSENFEKAEKILFGTPEAGGQDGLIQNVANLFWAIGKYGADPTIPLSEIAKNIENIAHGDDFSPNALSILFWGMWGRFVLYVDYYMAKNIARYATGRAPLNMPTPFILKPVVFVGKPLGVKLDGWLEKKGGVGSRQWRYEKFGQRWEKLWESTREKLYAPFGGLKDVGAVRKFTEAVKGLKNQANTTPVVGRGIGILEKIGHRGLIKPIINFTDLSYSNKIWGSLGKAGEFLTRWANLLNYGRKRNIRIEVAEDLGVETGDVPGKVTRNVYGNDYTNLQYPTDMSQNASFKVTLRGIEKGKAKVEISFDEGDPRVRIFEDLIKGAIKSQPQLELEIDGKKTLVRIGEVKVSSRSGIHISVYAEEGSNIKLARVEIGFERLKELKQSRQKTIESLTKEIAVKARETRLVKVDLFDFHTQQPPGVPNEVEPQEIVKSRIEAQQVFEHLVAEHLSEGEFRILVAQYQENQARLTQQMGGEIKEVEDRLKALEQELIEAKRKEDIEEVRRKTSEIESLSKRLEELKTEKRKGRQIQQLEKTIEKQRAEIKARLKKIIPARDSVLSAELVGQFKFVEQILKGITLTSSQMETIIAGDLGISSQKECSGGKTEIMAGILLAKVNGGKKAYAITSHTYYAKRDAAEMREAFEIFGYEIGVNEGERGEISRTREAFIKSITYTSLNDLMFLRMQNSSLPIGEQIPVEFKRAFIGDEGDFLIVDMSKTPLILSEGLGGRVGLREAIQWWNLARKSYQFILKSQSAENSFWIETNRGFEFTEAGLAELQRLGINTSEKINRFAKCIQARLMIARGQVFVDRISQEIKIIDSNMDRIMEMNRYESELHKALEAVSGFTVREDTKAIQSDTSLEVIFRFASEGEVVFISGTMDNPHVKAFCERLGIKVLSQGENVPRINVAELNPGETIEARVAILERKGNLSVRPKADGTAESPIKLVYNPDNPEEKATVDNYTENSKNVMVEGKQTTVLVSELQVHNPEAYLNKVVKAQAIVAKIKTLRTNPATKSTPIVVQLLGDAELGKLIESGLRGKVDNVVLLTHEVDSDATRKKVTESAGKTGYTTLGTFNRADNIRARKLIGIIAGVGGESWNTEQAWKRFARDVDSAELFPFYSLDEQVFASEEELAEIVEQYKKADRENEPLNTEDMVKVNDAIKRGKQKMDAQGIRQAQETLWMVTEFDRFNAWFEKVKSELENAKKPFEICKVFIENWVDFVVDSLYEEGKLKENWKTLAENKLAKVLGVRKIKLVVGEGAEANPEDLKVAIKESLLKHFNSSEFHTYFSERAEQFKNNFTKAKEEFRKRIRELVRRYSEMWVAEEDLRALTEEGKKIDLRSALQKMLRAEVREMFHGYRNALEGYVRNLARDIDLSFAKLRTIRILITKRISDSILPAPIEIKPKTPPPPAKPAIEVPDIRPVLKRIKAGEITPEQAAHEIYDILGDTTTSALDSRLKESGIELEPSAQNTILNTFRGIVVRTVKHVSQTPQPAEVSAQPLSETEPVDFELTEADIEEEPIEKVGDGKTVLTKQDQKTLKTEGILKKNGQLLVLDKEGKVTNKKGTLLIVELDGLSVETKGGSCVFSQNGETRDFSLAELLEFLSKSKERNILGREVKVFRGKVKTPNLSDTLKSERGSFSTAPVPKTVEVGELVSPPPTDKKPESRVIQGDNSTEPRRLSFTKVYSFEPIHSGASGLMAGLITYPVRLTLEGKLNEFSLGGWGQEGLSSGWGWSIFGFKTWGLAEFAGFAKSHTLPTIIAVDQLTGLALAKPEDRGMQSMVGGTSLALFFKGMGWGKELADRIPLKGRLGMTKNLTLPLLFGIVASQVGEYEAKTIIEKGWLGMDDLADSSVAKGVGTVLSPFGYLTPGYWWHKAVEPYWQPESIPGKVAQEVTKTGVDVGLTVAELKLAKKAVTSKPAQKVVKPVVQTVVQTTEKLKSALKGAKETEIVFENGKTVKVESESLLKLIEKISSKTKLTAEELNQIVGKFGNLGKEGVKLLRETLKSGKLVLKVGGKALKVAGPAAAVLGEVVTLGFSFYENWKDLTSSDGDKVAAAQTRILHDLTVGVAADISAMVVAILPGISYKSAKEKINAVLDLVNESTKIGEGFKMEFKAANKALQWVGGKVIDWWNKK